MVMGEAIRKVSDAESCNRGGEERRAVFGLEAAPRVNRDDLVAIYQLPALRTLHESLMSDEILRRFGSTVCFDVSLQLAMTQDAVFTFRRNSTSWSLTGALELANIVSDVL